MNLRQRMIPPRAINTPLRKKLRALLFWFWRDLWHVCDDFGRFEANPALLRAVLYSPILDRVSERDVEGYLRELHMAGGIKLYTVKEQGFGKVLGFEQPGMRQLKAEYPDEPGAPELFAGDDPAPAADPPRPKERKKKDVSEAMADLGPPPFRKGTHTPAPRKTSHLSSLEPRALDAYLDRLAATFPGVNIRGEIQRATAYVRRVRGPGAKLTLKFFEENWLPRTGGPSLADTAPIEHIPDEPEFWREMVNEEFPTSDYARGGAKEGTQWANLDADIRRHFLATLPAWLKRTGRSAA